MCLINNEPDGTVCTDDGNDCTSDVCGTGACTHPAEAVGTACGDPSDTDCDNPDSCDGAGACLTNNEPSGAVCEDGLYCTVEDSCDGVGSCLGGASRDCSDGVDCTEDSCNEDANRCDNTPSDALCDDDDICTDDTCTLAGCDNVFDPANDPTCRQPCPDADGDGYADCTVPECDPTGLQCGDCDDTRDYVNPGEQEICDDGLDNDCDGFTDLDDEECGISDTLYVHHMEAPSWVRLREGATDVRQVKVFVRNSGSTAERVYVLLTSDPAAGITITPLGSATRTVRARGQEKFTFAVSFTENVLGGESKVDVRFTAVAVDESGRHSNPGSPKKGTTVMSWPHGKGSKKDKRGRTDHR
jgi:hypothetical protein